MSYSAGGLDNDKRELILTSPLVYVTADGVQRPLQTQMVLIAGRNISRLDVTHLPADATADPSVATAPGQPAKALPAAGEPAAAASLAPELAKPPKSADPKALPAAG